MDVTACANRKYAVNDIFILLSDMFFMKFQNPYDAMEMMEIKNGKRYLSNEKSLAIMSVKMKVLTNHERISISDLQSLDFLIF